MVLRAFKILFLITVFVLMCKKVGHSFVKIEDNYEIIALCVAVEVLRGGNRPHK